MKMYFNMLIVPFLLALMIVNPCICQTEAMEADGFQADTEDDDEEDCIITAQSGELHRRNKMSLSPFNVCIIRILKMYALAHITETISGDGIGHWGPRSQLFQLQLNTYTTYLDISSHYRYVSVGIP